MSKRGIKPKRDPDEVRITFSVNKRDPGGRRIAQYAESVKSRRGKFQQVMYDAMIRFLDEIGFEAEPTRREPTSSPTFEL